MTAKECRHTAWGKLGGQWGTMAIVTLLSGIITSAASSLAGIGAFIVGGPLDLATAQMTLNISRGKKEKFENMFEGFKTNFGGSVMAYVLVYLFTFLWSLLFFIPGIIKSYSYAMTFYVLADNPNMAPNDARKRSMEIMHGNKWRLFCLDFSFIGWELLNMLTCGILSFWIVPYKKVAYAEFYRELVPETDSEKTAKTDVGGKTCPKCGANNEADAAFCTSCGAAMPVVAAEPKAASPTVFCTNCGAKNDPESAFCTSCGAKIK